MKKILIFMIGLLAVCLAAGCEDLEETYDEYAGDGTVRYVGKCADMKVAAGWNRLRVSWTNGADAMVKCTKITWKSDNDPRPFVRYVPRDAERLSDTVFLENLGNNVYAVTVSNLNADSTESLVTQAYARPYTEGHEDLLTYTRGIVNFYELGDKMAVVLDADNDNLEYMELSYWGTDGKEYSWDIKEHMKDSLSIDFGGFLMEYPVRDYMSLLPEEEDEAPGIDFSKPLVIKRQGKLAGCIDPVPFADEELPRGETIWSTAFMSWMTKLYGPNWENEVDRIETLELDYDISTLQDLFYLPNLKKVCLGKNRFMHPDHRNENRSVTDDYKGLMTLQFLKDTRGITVERYNNHYFNGTFPDVDYSGQPTATKYQEALELTERITWDLLSSKRNNEMPVVELLDTEGWEVTCTDTTLNGFKRNGGAYLLDDNVATYFEPAKTTGTTIYEVVYDMLEPQRVDGFKIVQPLFDTEDGLRYLLPSLKIEVSQDGYAYDLAYYGEGATIIGNAIGETTFIPVRDGRLDGIRYVRLTVTSRPVEEISGGQSLFTLRLGDVVPYVKN